MTRAQWAISARGFNGTSANKLLVLIDGRVVYTPLHAGVFWEVQDTLLEDIDRIEVISGPGATLWGANAVNGVINIITKTAADAQGVLVTGGGGSELRGVGGVRYGGTVGQSRSLSSVWQILRARQQRVTGRYPGDQRLEHGTRRVSPRMGRLVSRPLHGSRRRLRRPDRAACPETTLP